MSAATAQTANSALDFLRRRINYERTTTVPYRSGEFKLDRMRRLMQLLGDPQDAVKAIHIAGTKGKGSTAAMIAAVLQAAGHRTGLYTSPHLQLIEERIVVDGLPCPTDSFLKLAAQVQPAVEQIDHEEERSHGTGPTFFEVTTAMAFLHFTQEKVAAAVLEVGLGGRLDSTNICRPEVCVITSISFDHTRQLGHTLAQIAAEKAGIIKPGIPIISGVIDPEPRNVIAARAAELNAPLVQRDVDYGFVVRGGAGGTNRQTSSDNPVSSKSFDYWEKPLSTNRSGLALDTPYSVLSTQSSTRAAQEPAYELKNVQLKMLGNHQAANAATAIAAIHRLTTHGWHITDDAIRAGLSIAQVPARIEQLQSSPAIILDVAHNLASIEALLSVLREHFTARRRVLIFASSKDKDYSGMLKLVLPAFDTIFLTQYTNNPRAVDAGELLTIAQQIRSASNNRHPTIHATARPTDALRLARAIAQPDDLICIAGSFFLAAELRQQL